MQSCQFLDLSESSLFYLPSLFVRPEGQGSVSGRNVCEHALLGGMHGGIEGARVGGSLLSDQNAAVCYNWRA